MRNAGPEPSTLLDYAEALARPRSLLPAGLPELRHELRLTGLALAAAEKSVQIFYEQGLRPLDKQHPPWTERVTRQTRAAYAALPADREADGARHIDLGTAKTRLSAMHAKRCAPALTKLAARLAKGAAA